MAQYNDPPESLGDYLDEPLRPVREGQVTLREYIARLEAVADEFPDALERPVGIRPIVSAAAPYIAASFDVAIDITRAGSHERSKTTWNLGLQIEGA